MHPLSDAHHNLVLREYELRSKHRFDKIESVLAQLAQGYGKANFVGWANQILLTELGFELPNKVLFEASIGEFNLGSLYSQCVFEQFLAFSREFFELDPLKGQQKQATTDLFLRMGYHAVGIAPCADGRLAHMVSYILRMPSHMVRRKAHAGALFDVSESVRNWVFTEHLRFREAIPNKASEPTRYLKIAAYHFSKADPLHLGCAAHASEDQQAAKAALERLAEFKQAIENRFGCGATVDTVLLGVNTDDDSLRVHVPNEYGMADLANYVDCHRLYHQTLNLTAEQARSAILDALRNGMNPSGYRDDFLSKQPGIMPVLAWLIEQNMAQIQYVHSYESGCYPDLGHAERFIGIGHGFEEIQLRNLTYTSFLDTLEEGIEDVEVGIKIFKKLNVSRMLPIPIVLRFDYDGRVPGSKARVIKKAQRIEKLLHLRFADLSEAGLLHTLCTLRDYTGFTAAERLDSQTQVYN
ncbi:MAG: carboxysome shell carbonic anhydrase [Thiotrichales bacterium]|nr:carboxysome shell carbonic anhydrase [Thiotrichales bacterium]